MEQRTTELPDVVFDWHAGDDPAALRDREWLATNGLGGFASGSLLGINTRRYHGLLVPNLAQPKGRYVMISRLDEDVECGGVSALLGGAEFTDGRLESEAHRYLRQFRLRQLMPTWVFEVNGSVIEKTVVMPHGQNAVCVRYRLLQGDVARLRLRLFACFRRQDAVLNHADDWPFVLSVARRRHELTLRESPLCLRFGLRPDEGVFVAEERVSRDVLYRVERDRGYDHSENLFSPGYFAAELRRDAPVSFVATTQGWETLDTDGARAVEDECHRVERLISIAPAQAREGFAARLVLAADQFIILPGSRPEETLRAGAAGDEVRTVIAGYHWFGDWGRDTMISLDGLTLCTGRYREAGSILRTFSHYVRDGLLPNLFPEGEREALYHTVDATLWYFHAIDRYLRATNDFGLVRDLYPVLQDIVAHHVRGTHYHIGVDPDDGLIREGEEGYQLTWMDAKVGDWVVTPRRGKPVEIQALWYNALCVMAEWGEPLGQRVDDYRRRADQARASFNARFWNEAEACLYDVVDGENGDDASVRPNQIFSLSLRFPVLDEARWRAVVDAVSQQLVTPLGLRTLSPRHPDYKRNYHGDLRTRDAAYHQGTVWPWLMGHYIDAWMRVHHDAAGARRLLEAFPANLLDAGMGSISEIFDAEAPYTARGCIAQAWSVAEVLRAWLAVQQG